VSLPASGDKLRYCGRCGTKAYSSKRCAKEDWANHKRECENVRVRRVQGIRLAEHEAQRRVVGKKTSIKSDAIF